MDELGKSDAGGREEFVAPVIGNEPQQEYLSEDERHFTDTRKLIDRIREGDESAAKELLKKKYNLIQEAYAHLEQKLGDYLKSNELTYEFLEASGYIALHDFCKLEDRFVSDPARDAFTKKLENISQKPDFEARLDKVIQAHIYYELWETSLNETSRSGQQQEKVLITACRLYDKAVYDQASSLGHKPEQSEIEACLEDCITNNKHGGDVFRSPLDIIKMVESFREIVSLNGADLPMKADSPSEDQQLGNILFEDMLDHHRGSVLTTIKAVRTNNKKLNPENIDLWVERYGVEDGDVKTNAEVAERHDLSPIQVRNRVWQVSESLSDLARKGKFDQILEDDPEVMSFFKYSLYMDTVDNNESSKDANELHRQDQPESAES